MENNINLNYTNFNKSGSYSWNNFKLNLSGSLLSNNVIHYFISSFYDTIVVKEQIISYAIIFKTEFSDKTIRSISRVLIIDKQTSKDNLIDLLMICWELSNDIYHFNEINNLILSYRILRKHKIKSNSISKIQKEYKMNSFNLFKNREKEFKYEGLSLPNTTELNNWGKIINQDQSNSVYIQSNIKKGKQTIYFNIFKYKEFNLIQVFSNNTLLFYFKDYFINNNNNPTSFIRVYNNSKFIFEKGILKSKEIERKVQYIKPISKSLYNTENFLTLDIETKNINGILHPICISIFDGSKVFSFLIKDYNSEFELFSAAFNTFKARKYNYQRVFIHNLSYFDGVFLLKNLCFLGNVKPLIRNGRIYNIRLELSGVNKKKYIIYIRDSYLLLPLSLEKLGFSFKVKNIKTKFPIHSLNYLPLDYKGSLPSKNYFLNEKDFEEYNKTHKGEWVLRKELLKYCENDVISLYQVIEKFSLEIFRLYRIDIFKYMTLSSIAFAIFRSNFMSEDNLKIAKITGEMFEDIYKSYKGGIVDMYKPEGINLFLQDVNSEYPEAMCKDMPGGKVKYFEGELDLNEQENFGFFKAKIMTNSNLNIPVLPVKLNNTTLCPLGTWTDWYFSEELREAQNKYGYKITVLKGYIFERINVFSDYVNNLYSQKESLNKKHPRYLIVKLLLNMLYGRFGMKPDTSQTLIINSNETENFINNPDIKINDVIDLGNNKELLKITKINNKLDNNEVFEPNISIPIASAVVGYGRIKINYLKHFSGIKIYYSDTDCVVSDKQLPSQLLGTKLGQLKTENIIKIGYFVAPKVYGFIDNNLENVVKIKGFKNKLSFYELNFVLYKDTVIQRSHEKWYRNWSEGNIFIKKELYSLMVTGNKRQLIFDSYQKLVDTRPYIMVDGIILNNNIDYIYNITAPNFKDKLISAP